MAKIPHGFSWYNIIYLVLIVLLILAIYWGHIITPQVRATANQVANLNDLKKVDFRCDFHVLAGWLKCSGTL